MLKRKKLRQRGKLGLSRVFKELREGDRVVLMRSLSFPAQFPSRLQGKVGIVRARRGKAYVIALRDGKKEKLFIVSPVNLKKLQAENK